MASFGYALDISVGFYSGVSLRTARTAALTLRDALLRETGCSSQRRFSISRSSSSSSSDDGPGSSSSSSGSSSVGSSDSTPPTSPEPPSRATATTAPQQQATLRFSIAASFVGKPQEGRALKGVHKLSEDSPIARWRNELLDKHGRLANQRQSIKQKGKQKQPQQRISAGEDFFFVSDASSQDPAATSVIGVADGVGGWSESGVDSSIFSQALMFYANKAASGKKTLSSSSEADKTLLYPHDILQTAYKDLLEENQVVAGSSTACVITLDPIAGTMRAANLGDSSFSLIRDSSVVHTQPPQTHYFNCPYQLSKLPNHLAGDPSSITNNPMQADLFETKLQKGDLVLCYTDGFGDNVWMKELEDLYKKIMLSSDEQSVGLQKVEKLADTLVSYARICSEKTDKPSPFEYEARKHKLIYKGGKVDDICLIAILVDSAHAE